MARAEEGKQLDRAMNGPVDIFVDQWLDVGELALVDRAMQRARETPEAVLCHWVVPELGAWTANGPIGVLNDAGAGGCVSFNYWSLK